MRRALAIMLSVVFGFLSCSRLDRVRQVRTVADMQTISAKLEAVREQDPELLSNAARVYKIIRNTAGGRDAWGHQLLYLKKISDHKLSYVLISLGSDGKPNVRDSAEYFTMAERVIHEEPEQDIVFRDGHAITRAGK